jgi:hypothetical protein
VLDGELRENCSEAVTPLQKSHTPADIETEAGIIEIER